MTKTATPKKPKVIADNATAAEVWDRLQPQVCNAGKWRDEYADSFAVLVEAIVGFYEVCITLADPECGPLLVNPTKGTTYRNPLLDIKAGHINTINRFGTAFGLTPLSDAKLKAVPVDGIGELLKLMGGPV